jgi:hypothetical protein
MFWLFKTYQSGISISGSHIESYSPEFSRHVSKFHTNATLVLLLEILRGVSSQLEYTGLSVSDPNKRGSLKVKDISFDPEYEESVADYRAEMPIGPLRKHRLKDRISRRSSFDPPQSAPWKRIM